MIIDTHCHLDDERYKDDLDNMESKSSLFPELTPEAYQER